MVFFYQRFINLNYRVENSHKIEISSLSTTKYLSGVSYFATYCDSAAGYHLESLMTEPELTIDEDNDGLFSFVMICVVIRICWCLLPHASNITYAHQSVKS